MTFKISLSQIKALPFDFEKAVADFIKAKQDHRFTVSEPAPMAPHNWVECAVRRVPGSIEETSPDDFVADYQIDDDTPSPPSLGERKAALADKVAAQAQVIIDGIDPPLKRRLAMMDYQNAMAVDEKKRTPAQAAVITAAKNRQARITTMTYHLATLEAQIHDLTDETIDAWSPPPFPN